MSRIKLNTYCPYWRHGAGNTAATATSVCLIPPNRFYLIMKITRPGISSCVEMKNMTGIELARRIRKDDSRTEIIFTTAHFEFAGEGYEVDALHYLVKPVSDAKLMQVLDKAAQRLSVEPLSVVINCSGETLRLYESDILYVESFLHYILIHTKDNEYRIKENLSAFAQKLSDDFYRVHRSYLVSLKHITRISRTSVSVGRTELPLSRGKYDDIHRAFIEHN